jgi:hypothetical protein
VIGATFPNVVAAAEGDDRVNQLQDLVRLAAALQLHRRSADAYPETLDALVPDYFAELPADPAGRRPYNYDRTADGFLLYSLGKNGHDDGGSNQARRVYKGFDINPGDELLSARLGEPLPEESATETPVVPTQGYYVAPGVYTYSTPPVDPLTSYFERRIPNGADDIAIRLPPLYTPWPE